MAYSTNLQKINNADDYYQHASLTNKLPYYVRRLCKSTNRKTTAVATSKPSKYSKKNRTPFELDKFCNR